MRPMVARAAALSLITVLIGGLGVLRFGPDSGTVSVPAGAKAGDLRLERCRFPTENGDLAAECGLLVVPENREDAGSRLIALPVTRVRSRSAGAAAPVFHLDGGPGHTNMEFPTASRLAAQRDVVMVGYRGVDGSSVLDCPEVDDALRRSEDLLGAASFRGYANGFRACAARLTGDGVDLAGYTLKQRVDDLETARTALGYGPIDLLSESAGTRTAMIYAWRYPGSVHRSVMIGANPPGHFRWDPAITDEQIRRYSDLCTTDGACRTRTRDLAASMRRTTADLPDRWMFLPIKDGNVRLASFLGLMESTSASPIAGPATLDSWLAAAEGDPSGLWLMSFAADLIFPTAFVWGDSASISRADADVVAGAGAAPDSILRDAGTAFFWGGGELVGAWPAAPGSEYDRVHPSSVPTLLIGGTLDMSTPPRVATEELLPTLQNGHQVVLSELGHTMDFWAFQPAAGTHLVTEFLDAGRVDDSRYEPVIVDFTPAMRQSTLAKIIVGTLGGLAALTLLSLGLMAWRVRRRGGFGPKASATLRSVYPIVLGFGGWSIGAMLALTALPGVPLSDSLLVTCSIGLPVGLGVALARTRREAASIAAMLAMGGGLLGAWLGFHATDGVIALVTAMLGATAGANLPLLILDWNRPSERLKVGTA